LNFTSTNLDPPSGPRPVEEYAEAPVWLQRLFTFVYVLFCMTLGLALVTLPWTEGWFEDGFVAQWPTVQHWLHMGFVRGAVSGLGLIDIWLGILEAVQYRDRPPAPAGTAPGLDRVSHDQQQ
jgi:hypothetical protein